MSRLVLPAAVTRPGTWVIETATIQLSLLSLGPPGSRSMTTAQRSTPTGFERVTTSAWRSVRRLLPQPVAEAIRKPAKPALRAVGVIRNV